MNSRFRFLTALLALFAFSAYFAEGVWAATCLPEMGHAGVEEVTPLDAGEQDCPMAGSHASSPSESPDTSEHPGSEAPRCPLGPLGATGSCVAVSLPAPTLQIEPSFPEGTMLSLSPTAARELLLAAALFHPPRA